MDIVDLMREYVRIADMCKGTDVKPWECVKIISPFNCHPLFNENPDNYKFAIAILEGSPVFSGDVLYNKLNGNKMIAQEYDDYLSLSRASWEPTAKQRTFILELNEKEIDFLASLIDPSFYACDPSVRSIRLKAQSLLAAARDKE